MPTKYVAQISQGDGWSDYYYAYYKPDKCIVTAKYLADNGIKSRVVLRHDEVIEEFKQD